MIAALLSLPPMLNELMAVVRMMCQGSGERTHACWWLGSSSLAGIVPPP